MSGKFVICSARGQSDTYFNKTQILLSWKNSLSTRIAYEIFPALFIWQIKKSYIINSSAI